MDISFYLYLLFAVDSLGVCLALPIYATYIITLGGNEFTVGLISSSAAFISLISNPIIGSLSDSKGRRSLLVKCLLAAIVGNILYVIAPTWHFVFLGKIIAAFGSSIGILQKAILGDLVESEDLKKIFIQKSMVIQGVMMVTMSGFSGYVSELKYGYSMIYSSTALAYMLSIVIILSKLPDDKKNKSKENISLVTRSVRELKSVVLTLKDINWPVYWDIFAMRAGTEIGFSFYFTNLGIFMVQEFDLTGSKSGNFFMISGVFIILANILRMKLTKIYPTSNDYSTIVKCATIFAFSFLAVTVTPSIYIVYLANIAITGSGSFLASTYNEMLTVRTNESDRGRLISSFENLVLIAQFIAPFTSGILSFFLSTRVLIGLAFIPAILTSLVAYRQLTSNARLKMETHKK